MEQQRNSKCWYVSTCNDDCERCTVYTQLKWQMDNSGLYESQQSPITLYIQPNNEIDRETYKMLANVRQNIVDYTDAGTSFYICSDECGNGKTSWAIKLLQSYLHHTAVGNYENLMGMFVSVPDLLIRLKDFKNPHSSKYRENLENVNLVVFDDVAVTNGISQFDYLQLFNVINNRMLAGKSCIFTSNVVGYDDLEGVLGQRLASRIYRNCLILELKGTGVR